MDRAEIVKTGVQSVAIVEGLDVIADWRANSSHKAQRRTMNDVDARPRSLGAVIFFDNHRCCRHPWLPTVLPRESSRGVHRIRTSIVVVFL
jgi:hypothetical protein